jgi:fructose-1,6-bisphosphatase II
MQCRLYFRNEEERQNTLNSGIDVSAVLGLVDLVKSDDVFFAATGITDGELLRGVRYSTQGATTDSIVMRSRTRTIRYIRAVHHRAKLAQWGED